MEKMKFFIRRILVLQLIIVVAFSSIKGQVPYGMKYQAVVRDNIGRIIENKTVGVEINIVQGSTDGNIVFTETHQKTTNDYGLIYLVIGSVEEEQFREIDWSNGPYFIQIGIDIDGGINYIPYGTSELMSVPYALYALHAENGGGVDTLYINDTTDIQVSTFIANVVDDYGAVGDGSTDNAQAFADALNENNDVFIPEADNDYILSNLTIPSGKRLWFERGAVVDVTGTMTGDNTEIIAGDYQIFTGSSNLSGSWKGGIAFDSWMGNGQQISGMNAMVTSADTTRWAQQTEVSDSAYDEAWDGDDGAASKNAIYDKIESLELSGGSSFIANIVDDYGAVGDGSTDNAQAFADALNENNDIFIPEADNDYVLSNLTIPSGKRLWFERGAILDVTGTITGDNTELIAGDYQIFTGSSNLSGSWKGGIAFDSWMGNGQQISGMNAMVTSADTTRWAQQTEVSDSAFSESWDGDTGAASKNAIYDKIQSISLNNGSSFIANVVDDYAAIGDGVTDNAQAFGNALNENNDIFIPEAEDNYVISNLTIPAGKRLWFERGAVIDVTGTMTGDTTELIAGDYQIFTGSSNLSGSWKGGIAFDSWMGNGQQISGMNAMVTSADTARWAQQTEVSDSVYADSWDGDEGAASKNAIYDKIESLQLSGGGSSFIANIVDDYGAVGDGTTNNAIAFANALIENNDIFIPAADDNYMISNLTIPPHKRLWFERGAVLDVTGTMTGDTTEIVAGEYQVFTSSSTLSGTWKGGIAYDCWLGNNQQIPGMSAMVTSADTARWGIDTFGSGSFIANVIDYGAVSDGTTDNAQAFTDALQDNNDIFIPDGDSTYLISSLIIPHGRRMWFASKAKLDVTGTLTGDSTEIMAGDQKLFTNTSTLDGTWKSSVSYDSWSGKNEQIPGMSAMVTPADTSRWGIDTFGSGSFIANVIDYGAAGDGSTEDSAAFNQALSENNDVFIPNTGYEYKISKLTIPAGKSVWFANGAVLDITNHLTIDGEIVAGRQKIFTIESADKINAENAIFERAYPEWFGAVSSYSDTYKTINRKAIQAVSDVFGRYGEIYFGGDRYVIDSTIIMPPRIKWAMKPRPKGQDAQDKIYGVLQPSNDMNMPLCFFYKGSFYIRDFSAYIPNYLARGGSGNVYNSFVLEGKFDEMAGNPIYHREPSYFDGINLYTPLPATPSDGPGLRYNGIKWDVREESETGYSTADYFSYFYRVNMVGADTGIYFSGDSKDLGHVNSEFVHGYNTDKCLHSIVIDEMSRGNYFDGVNIQIDYRTPNQSWQKTTQIDIKSFRNQIYCHIDDEQSGMDSLIIFRQVGPIPGGTGNVYCKDNYVACADKLRNYTTYQQMGSVTFSPVYKLSNKVGHSPYWKWASQDGRNVLKLDADNQNFDLGIWVKGYAKFEDALMLKPRPGAPGSPVEGMIYVNSSNHHIYCYLNGAWRQLD